MLRVHAASLGQPFRIRLRTQASGLRSVYACLECQKSFSDRRLSRPVGRLIYKGLYGRDSGVQVANSLPEDRTRNDQETLSTSSSEERHLNIGVQAALGVLWLYKNAISPLLPKSCRFIPTCSTYAQEAYMEFGFCKGSFLTTWRILRCNPLSKGGFDPPSWPPIGLAWLFTNQKLLDK